MSFDKRKANRNVHNEGRIIILIEKSNCIHISYYIETKLCFVFNLFMYKRIYYTNVSILF